METISAPLVKHYEMFDRYEPAILDNSAIMEYKKCGLRYFYRYVLGYTDKITAPYFVFGTCYHKFREELELGFAKYHGEDKHDVLAACALSLGNALNIAEKLWQKQTQGEAFEGKYSFLNLERFKQSAMFAFEWWKKEKISGQIVTLSVEEPFVVTLPNGVRIGGRTDANIRWRGNLYKKDYKTSSQTDMYYQRSLNPNAQFATYTWAGNRLETKETVHGVIVEVLYNTKTTGPKIVPYPVQFTEEQLHAWERDTIKWTDRIMDSRATDHYEANENACSFCPFHSVCRMPNSMARASVLKNQYHFKLWDFQNPDAD